MMGRRARRLRRPASRQASRSAAASRAAAARPPTAATGTAANCPTPDDLISDFEIDNSLAPVDGRQGGWYTYGDDVGTFAKSTGYDIGEGNPNCSATGSLHVKGTGFAMWGAATGVDWKPRPADGDGGYGEKMTYDASAYRGIAFWAKASAPLDGVQVSFPDLYTDNAAPKHDMPDLLDPTMFMCRDCVCIYVAGFRINCSPYLVQFGKKGDAAADVLFSGYSTSSSTRPGSGFRSCSSTPARTPATAATTRRPTG